MQASRNALSWIAIFAVIASAVTPLAVASSKPVPKEKWIPLFNGKNIDGWTPKIKGYEFGNNFANTFRVEKGVIKVSYDGYGGEFKERFGHLFFKTPYSSYKLRVEYRFTGDQIKDGPGWAWRNSGIMIHCQDPKSMGKDQDFPVSAEVQLLGAGPEGERSTGNLCTPGTNVVMDGKLVTQHCINSNSKSYRGDDWVTIEVEIHGAGKVAHRYEGVDVINYEQVQLDPNDADGKKLIKGEDKLVKGGWISLQSESHPVEFRKVEILPLKD